jgi:hypothetical protein
MFSYSVRSEDDFRVDIVATDKASSESLFDVLWFCLLAFHEPDQPNRRGMDIVNWHKKSHTLLYKMHEDRSFITGRGRLFLLYNRVNQLIAISGMQRARFDPLVFIGGVHSFVTAAHQGSLVIAKYLIPLQIRQAETMGGKTFVLPFSETKNVVPHDKNIEQTWDFANIFKKKQYPECFHNMYLYPERIALQGQVQYALIKEIEKGYKPKFLEVLRNHDTGGKDGK